jgi:hypothetical protein
MARRDDLHFPARRALEKDGWQITHDPLPLYLQGVWLKADLGGARYMAATNGERRIAVEVKDFADESVTSELERMIGQMMLYQWALDEVDPKRTLWLAINQTVYDEYVLDETSLFHAVIRRFNVNLRVVDQLREEILQWISR